MQRILKKLLLTIGFCAALTGAAQAQYVQQSGTQVTPGHPAVWVGNGVIGDGGTAAAGNLTSIGITASGPGICQNSAAITSGGYNQLCFSVYQNAPAQITLQNYGSANPQNFQIVINGTPYSFPGNLSTIVAGTTPISGGTNNYCLYDASGVVGMQACQLSAITALTGDGTATGPGSSVFTLATVNTNIGMFGSSTQIPVVTVNNKGLITGASNTAVAITAGTTNIVSGTNNAMDYDSGGVFAQMSVVDNAVVSTNGSGVPAESTTLPSGLTIPSPIVTGTLAGATVTATSLTDSALNAAGHACNNSSGLFSTSTTACSGDSITGSGSFVLATSPSISGLTVTSSFTATGLVTNSDLASAITTINSTPCTLGNSCSITATATSMTVGTTSVLSASGSNYLLTTGSVTGGTGTLANISLTYPQSIVSGALTWTGPTTSGRLAYSSATAITFTPFSGDTIRINGVVYQIPSSGIAGCGNTSVYVNGSSGQNLGSSTHYWVYIFNNSGTLTCNFATTGHATSSTAGNIGTEIESGTDADSLIGQVLTNSSSQFQQSSTCACVRSWFNDPGALLSANLTSDTTSTSTTTGGAELSSSLRLTFLPWGNEIVRFEAHGTSANGTSGSGCYTGIGFDGNAASSGGTTNVSATGGQGEPATASGYDSGLTETSHYATAMVKVSANTCTWYATSLDAGWKFVIDGKLRWP